MKQALWDKLLSAAQDVVNDADPGGLRGLTTVDTEIMHTLRDVVEEISRDAEAEIRRVLAENRGK